MFNQNVRRVLFPANTNEVPRQDDEIISLNGDGSEFGDENVEVQRQQANFADEIPFLDDDHARVPVFDNLVVEIEPAILPAVERLALVSSQPNPPVEPPVDDDDGVIYVGTTIAQALAEMPVPGTPPPAVPEDVDMGIDPSDVPDELRDVRNPNDDGQWEPIPAWAMDPNPPSNQKYTNFTTAEKYRRLTAVREMGRQAQEYCRDNEFSDTHNCATCDKPYHGSARGVCGCKLCVTHCLWDFHVKTVRGEIQDRCWFCRSDTFIDIARHNGGLTYVPPTAEDADPDYPAREEDRMVFEGEWRIPNPDGAGMEGNYHRPVSPPNDDDDDDDETISIEDEETESDRMDVSSDNGEE
jgi:hypothetical protein